MRVRPFLGAMLSLLLWALAPASAQTASEQAGIRQALHRGAMIYAYDQAAWHGTDDLVAKHKEILSEVGGWIVDGPAEAATVVFHDKNKADPQALYIAEFRGNMLVSSKLLGAGDDRTLNSERKRLIAAKRASVSALIEGKAGQCVDKPFNTVVLPPTQPSEPILVYYLTPQIEAGTYPIGGHYLVEVPAEGKPTMRRFTNSCLAMPRPAGQPGSSVMFVTHLLGPVPTELHVFTSLAAQVPVGVIVDEKRVWVVNGSRQIELADLSKAK